VAVDIIQKYKEGLQRIRDNLADTNTSGCMNNSSDLTHVSNFVDFDEGVLIGEILESIFDNFDDVVKLYDYKKEEIEPVKKKIDLLIKFLENNFPPKDNKSKAELYDILVSTRFQVTKLQVAFMRERETKNPPNPFEPPI
jgi:hypothetical protein